MHICSLQVHNTQLHEATKSDPEVLHMVSHAIAFSTTGSSLTHTNRKEQRVENAHLFIVHNNTQLRELVMSPKVVLKYLHVVSHETTCSTAGSSLAHRNRKEQRVKNAPLFTVQVVPARWQRWRCRRT